MYCPACLSKLLSEIHMKSAIDNCNSGLIKTGGTLLRATSAASLKTLQIRRTVSIELKKLVCTLPLGVD